MTEKRAALVTGITGQDGAYLADLLLGKGYEVHGLARDVSGFDFGRLSQSAQREGRIHLHGCDLTDYAMFRNLVAEIRPGEIYNLAAQSHVPTSIAEPQVTSEINAKAPIRLMEAILDLGLDGHTRLFLAASSEIFGEAGGQILSEDSVMAPRNPYALSKYHSYVASQKFRKERGLFVVNGILFNHESPYRSPAFVTRKITLAVASTGNSAEPLRLGNLDARRDWGHARDYVEGMWLSLQRDVPDDYVFATGENHSVREFVELAFEATGRRVRWEGAGKDEIGFDADSGVRLVEVDPAFFRPSDIGATVGDSSKARAELNWQPRTNFAELVREMLVSDMARNG
ncbi:GDP-mannose 4,6-dehydratase [Parvibaculum sp.]|uniref:GDP-mannose 4,6-dehydratase n=1 Tax=Parvibaculum sp. TaxID=2024848 RepID=UPI000C35C1F3|nr:GDP-mannose 4,6-dehydratase [Parvibaculum sp.]MAM94852.1 GDP-mannose 4,6-dehydratase [Parvibaculum sp.]HCX67955.1 GDP-mannose 4,6-dehydratase [Rhodobiaceae bacterium]|tara:strand:+ start:22546 stop:23574 length:1029 start_codon:yes stop_codon:yes gene_type:complete